MAERMGRQQVNALLKRVSIKGKEYIEVSQRVNGFWELYPNGSIVTSKDVDNGQRCDFTAEVYADRADERPIATGHAYEERKGLVNSTSYIENCETSAIGRALGIAGIGLTDSLASADEVASAIARQQPDPLVEAKNRAWRAMKAWASRMGKGAEEVAEGVKKRPDYAESPDFWLGVADEFEADLTEEAAR